MTKNKLKKFAEILEFSNVYENFDPTKPKLTVGLGKEAKLKNGWVKDHFKNDNPLVVELACGRGEYSLGLAAKYPNRNFLGVDVKGARIWKGAKMALDQGFSHVAFLRTRIEQLRYFFKEKEISEIWITFPDPFLKKENRRLTSPRFLDSFYPLLVDNGIIHLKTDSIELYDFTLEVLKDQEKWTLIENYLDIYKGSLPHPDLDIKTYYEHMHLEANKKITYIAIQKH